MRRVRGSVSTQQALNAGEAISDRLAAWPGWRRSSVVVLFATVRGEVETRPLIRLALEQDKKMIFPRMVAGPSLEFAVVDDPESLQPGRHGVLEPDPSFPAWPLSGEELIFVPGLAFDRNGGRLGQGAGYYDRALAGFAGSERRPQFIGVGFAWQIVGSVPVDSHDVRMDRVVTEVEFFEVECPPEGAR
jgi:5-formyltetrahydrofolate cyclo-ligase